VGNIAGYNAGETYTAAILRNSGVSGIALVPKEAMGAIVEDTPDEAAIEQTFVNKDAGATLKLGQARGVVLLAPARLLLGPLLGLLALELRTTPELGRLLCALLALEPSCLFLGLLGPDLVLLLRQLPGLRDLKHEHLLDLGLLLLLDLLDHASIHVRRRRHRLVGEVGR
jgi:hypothetical protein